MGGNVQSNQAKALVDSITSIATKNVVNANVQNTVRSNSTNTVDVSFGKDCPIVFKSGKIEISQKNVAAVKLDANTFVSAIQKSQTDIIKDIQNLLTSNLNNKQGFLSLAVSIQQNKTEIENKIKSFIQSMSKMNFTDVCAADVNQFNSGHLDLCGYYENTDVVVKQNNAVTVAVSCIVRAILNQLQKTGDLESILNKADQKLASEQEGIASLFFYLIIGAGVVIGGIILIVIIVAVVKKRGRAAPVGVQIPMQGLQTPQVSQSIPTQVSQALQVSPQVPQISPQVSQVSQVSQALQASLQPQQVSKLIRDGTPAEAENTKKVKEQNAKKLRDLRELKKEEKKEKEETEKYAIGKLQFMSDPIYSLSQFLLED